MPAGEPDSDAEANVRGALAAAASCPGGAWVAFSDPPRAGCALIQGGWARKIGLDDTRFIDVTGTPWGWAADSTVAQAGELRTGPLGLDGSFGRHALALPCSPGLDWEWLADGVVRRPPDALVLETYVSGTVPPGCTELARAAAAAGVCTVVVAPTPVGASRYPSMGELAAVGASIRLDLTIELATCCAATAGGIDQLAPAHGGAMDDGGDRTGWRNA